MIVLDENILSDQYALLQRKRIRARQIGKHLGWSGMNDAEVITLLHGLKGSTFFTMDLDYHKSRLIHGNYCLVYLAVESTESARYVIRFLAHREFNAKRKRMGAVVRISFSQISYWRKGQQNELSVLW